MSMCFTEFGKLSLGWGGSREVEKLLLIVGIQEELCLATSSLKSLLPVQGKM